MNSDLSIADLLNAQTGRIGWSELARHFARGTVIRVAPGEDLVKVAEWLVADCADEIERLHQARLLRRAGDDDARRWQQNETEFWAVVVAPWVLVQEVIDGPG